MIDAEKGKEFNPPKVNGVAFAIGSVAVISAFRRFVFARLDADCHLSARDGGQIAWACGVPGPAGIAAFEPFLRQHGKSSMSLEAMPDRQRGSPDKATKSASPSLQSPPPQGS